MFLVCCNNYPLLQKRGHEGRYSRLQIRSGLVKWVFDNSLRPRPTVPNIFMGFIPLVHTAPVGLLGSFPTFGRSKIPTEAKFQTVALKGDLCLFGCPRSVGCFCCLIFHGCFRLLIPFWLSISSSAFLHSLF